MRVHRQHAVGGFRGRGRVDNRQDVCRSVGGFGFGAFVRYPTPDARHAAGAALYSPVVLDVAEDVRDDQHDRRRQTGEHDEDADVH
ncbi:hypothetical protein QRX60_17660 [Amycolatopsis mongoliensis]|uniref:Uncharacterized protein n=1 Tax=Amycolatopsis mongoliensis TaxID=715475 RepID=A0A9Y2NN67_9PSEU|nr:hypothetical protein [Amycolatopsis sp. 4-36]WIY05583.1 hypothetical protein QRX60_17660 [Amycolatopsis sp. 4-36]